MNKILVVEDEGIVAWDIKNKLQKLGYAVPALVAYGEEVLQVSEETQPDLVLMDIRLKGKMDGIEAAWQLRVNLDIPVIYLTAFADKDTIERAKETAPFGYLLKPFEERELHASIEMALHRCKMESKLKESKLWISTRFDSTNDPMLAVDTKGNVIFINPAAESLTGWDKRDALGKPIKDILYNKSMVVEETFRDFIDKIIHENTVVKMKDDNIFTSKDGTKIYLADSGAPIIDDNNEIMGVVFPLQDITEHIHAKEALAESTEKYKSLVESATDAIFTLNEDGDFLSVNQEVSRALGKKPEDIIGKNMHDVFPENVADFQLKAVKSIFNTGEPIFAMDSLTITAFGERWYNTTLRPIIDENGEITCILGIARDVTERKWFEEKLKESEKKYRLLADNSSDVIWTMDIDLKFTYVSPSIISMLGYTPEEILFCSLQDILTPPSFLIAVRSHRKRIETEHSDARENQTIQMELEYIKKDGSTIWTEVVTNPITDEQGRFIGVIGSSRDITERKHVEKALKQSERQFRSLFENATIGIYRTTPEGRIIISNPTLIKMLGYSSFKELAERNLEENGFVPISTRNDFKTLIKKNGEVRGFESVWKRRDGTNFFGRESAKIVKDIEGNILYYEGTVEDISEKKEVEAEREKLVNELREALTKIKVLNGLVPICANCKKIRDDKGYWNQIEKYIMEHSDAVFTHGFCPDCAKKLYPDVYPE